MGAATFAAGVDFFLSKSLNQAEKEHLWWSLFAAIVLFLSGFVNARLQFKKKLVEEIERERDRDTLSGYN